MADHSPIIHSIRAAIEVEFARSPAPPTVDDFAAAVLRAVADHGEAMEIRMAPGCYDFDEAVRCRDMEAIAAELEGGAGTSSTH